MPRIALFPGSFDPITLGHVNIVERAIPLFDEIILAVGENAEKHYLFPLEQRLAWLRSTFAQNPSVKVISYQGLTVDFAASQGANFLLRAFAILQILNLKKPLPKPIGRWPLPLKPSFY